MTKGELLPLAQRTQMPPSSNHLSLLRIGFQNLLCFVIGLLLGSHLTFIWLSNKSQCNTLPATVAIESPVTKTTDQYSNNTVTATTPIATAASAMDTMDIGEYLHNSTRILCWIMTNPNNHMEKAIHIRNTWGRRCNKLLFMSTEEDEELHTIKLDVEEGREHLWDKTKNALKYIYDNHLDDAEWFLKADDDTYVILENLRSFLYQYPSEAPLYFGCKFSRFLSQGYMSGGAGYVLSKTSLIKFATEAFNNTETCADHYNAEDLQLGKCLQNIGVIAGDTRDENGLERFIPLSPNFIIPEDKSWWYKLYVYHEPNKNVTCCSPSAISFHYIFGDQFYIMEYLLYNLKPFGVFNKLDSSLRPKINLSDIYSGALEYFYPLPSPLLPLPEYSDDDE